MIWALAGSGDQQQCKHHLGSYYKRRTLSHTYLLPVPIERSNGDGELIRRRFLKVRSRNNPLSCTTEERVVCITCVNPHILEGLSRDVIVMVCFADGTSFAKVIRKEHSLEPTRLEPESRHFRFLGSVNVNPGRPGQQLLHWSNSKISSWRVLGVYKTAFTSRLSSGKPLRLPESLSSASCQLLECVIL